MAEDEEKMKKMRLRMERDAYAVLVSFKDGATPKQLENKMDDTLGYTYNNKYYQGGIHDMAQLLREHKQVRQMNDGKFKIVATEEIADLVALISKQKDNKKKKRGGGPSKPSRPMTSTGYCRTGFGGLRASPKGFGGFRSASSLGRPNFQKNNPFSHHSHPSTSVSFSRPSTSTASNISNFRQPNSNIVLKDAKTQRPLPSTSHPTTPRPSQYSQYENFSPAKPAKPASKTCQMPSIKEFSDNTKKMMMKLYPKVVHLSELTELYSQEQGFVVDPLQLFSKSWKMLAITTFKDWMDLKDGEVTLKGELAKRCAAKKKEAINSSTMPDTRKTETPLFPSIQGFRYAPPKSPTDLIVQKLKCLTMGAHQASATSDKSPRNGLLPQSSMAQSSLQKIPNVYGTSYSEEMSEQVSVSIKDQEYDSQNMCNLRNVQKPVHMMEKILSALEGTTGETIPQIKPKKNSKTSKALVRPKIPQKEMVQPRMQERHSLMPKRVEMKAVDKPKTPTATPPEVSQGRTRPTFTKSCTPPSLLIGKALAEVKKQDDLKPIPRRPDPAPSSAFIFESTVVQNTECENDMWNEPKGPLKSRSGSIVGRKPIMLPPMSKGAGMGSILRRDSSFHQSDKSSRSSSVTRRYMDEAVNSELPDSDKDLW